MPSLILRLRHCGQEHIERLVTLLDVSRDSKLQLNLLYRLSKLPIGLLFLSSTYFGVVLINFWIKSPQKEDSNNNEYRL